MRHNILLTLCVFLSLLIALPSIAQEVMGLYFDPEGTQTEFTTSAPMEMVPVYLILHNPDFEDPITGWECELSTSGAAALMPMEIVGDGGNQYSSPAFHVEYTTPLPPAEVTILATGQILVMEPELAGRVYINPIAGPMTGWLHWRTSVAFDGDWIPVDNPSECETDPIALVNDDSQVLQPSIYTVPSVLHFESDDLEPITIHNTGPMTLTATINSTNGNLRFGIGSIGWGNSFSINIQSGRSFSFLASSDWGTPTSTTFEVSTCSGLLETYSAFPGPTQLLSVNPLEVDFGTVLFPPVEPVTREFHVENGGTDAFSFEIVQNPEFEVQIDQGVIHPGEYRLGTVTFSPEESGPTSCDVVFTNSHDQQVTLLQCSGNTGEACQLSTDILDFQQVGMGFPTTQGFSLTNYSEEVLEGFATIAFPTSGFSITSGLGAFSLLTGQSQHFSVSFDPAIPGPETNWVDFGTGCDPVELAGTGVDAAPVLTASPPNLVFPPVYAGYSRSATLTVSNDGNLPYEGNFQISGMQFSCPDTGHFFLEASAGSSKDFTIIFSPTDTLNYFAEVAMNPDTGLDISLSGEGLGQVPVYSIDPPDLHFGYIPSGEPTTKTIVIHNFGPDRLVGSFAANPQVETPFSVVPASADFNILAGQDHEVEIFFDGTVGNHGAFLDVEIPLAESYQTTAVCRMGDNQANLGVYFDLPDFEENQIFASAGTIVYAYLVGRNPGLFQGWESCLEILGENEVLSFNQQGGHPNTLEPPCFRVTTPMGVSFPNETSILTIRILIACDDCYTKIRLYPVQEPQFADSIAMWQNFYSPFSWTRAPYQVQTSTGDPLVATINSQVVAVQFPRPMATTNGGIIQLQWHLNGDYDACHVYRRIGEDSAQRITETPIPVVAGRVQFQDQPPTAPGASAYYSYGAMIDGQEVGMSPETMIQLDQLLPKITALKGNYPNPFNPKTTLQFDLAEPSEVVLQIYDLSGRRIRTLIRQKMPAGSHEQIWQGRNDDGHAVPSGVYFARLQAGFQVMMRKIALLK